ncbi:MAG: flagellar hook-length control protein FliK [Magnetococcales bacterium]|nr:flagellar hook-length control protein FliK [Magnetococcales bacterium]
MASLNVSAPAAAPAVDWVALLSKSAVSLTASKAVNPSFDATLGHAISEKADTPSQAALSRLDGRKGQADKMEDAKAEAARIKKNRTERAQGDKGDAEESENSAAKVEQAGEDAAARSAAAEQGTEETTDPAQVAQKREQAKLKVVDPHGADGVGQMGVREQVVTRLLHAEPLVPVVTDLTAVPLSPEALRLQLAQLGIGVPGEEELPVLPTAQDAGIRITSAILPSTSLAVLAERLAQSKLGEKAALAEEPAHSMGKLQAAGDTATTAEAGLRSSASSRSGTMAGPGAPLAARGPDFADDLMERVGRMRIFSRGGQEEQLRVTLEPEDLGTIDLRLRVDAQNQVHLLITTETDEARHLLQRQLAQLQEALARQDMGFGHVTVEVGDQQQGNQAASQWGFAERREESAGRRGSAVEEEGQSQPVEQPKGIVSTTEGVSIIV